MNERDLRSGATFRILQVYRRSRRFNGNPSNEQAASSQQAEEGLTRQKGRSPAHSGCFQEVLMVQHAAKHAQAGRKAMFLDCPLIVLQTDGDFILNVVGALAQ